MEAKIRSGHPDLHGLCLALSDWSEELRRIERDMAQNERAEGLNPSARCY